MTNRPDHLLKTRTPRRSISQKTMKYSSRAPGQGACLKGMSRTITMQGFRLAAISDVDKNRTLM